MFPLGGIGIFPLTFIQVQILEMCVLSMLSHHQVKVLIWPLGQFMIKYLKS